MSLESALPALWGLASFLYLVLGVHLIRTSPQSLIGVLMLLLSMIVAGPAFFYGTDDATRFGIGRALTFLGTGFVPVTFYALYRQYTEDRVNRFVIVAMLVVPSVTLVMAMTNPWHNLTWAVVDTPDGQRFTAIDEHLWFRAVFMPYAFGVLGYAWVALLSRLGTIAPAHRAPILLLLFCSAVPYAIGVGNLVFGIGPHGFPVIGSAVAAMLPLYAYVSLTLRIAEFSPLGFRTVFDHVRDALFVLDTDNRVVSANTAACRMLDTRQRAMLGRVLWDVFPQAKDLLAGTDLQLTQTLSMSDDVVYEISAAALNDRKGRQLGTVVTCRDVTQRRRTLGQLAENEQLIRSLIETSSNGILRFALDELGDTPTYRCIFANPAAQVYLGRNGEDIVGKPLDGLKLLEPERLTSHFGKSGGTRRHVSYELAIDDEGAAETWLRITAEPIGTDFSITIVDITKRKEDEQRMLQQALRDPLTGVFNRRGFEAQARDRLRQSDSAAVIYLDLNGFKQVNDRHGHQAGDALLKAFGHRLGYCLRPEDVLGRLGGDEFAIVLPDVGIGDAMHVADRLIATGTEAYIIKGDEIRCSVSVGVALMPEHGEELWHLVSVADQAMYANKAKAANEERNVERTDSVHGKLRAEHTR